MRLFLLVFVVFILGCGQKKYDNPHILIDTNYGEITVELYPTNAPKTVKNFLQYIDSGLYKNTTFYRVLKNDDLPADANDGLIQGGIYPADKKLQGIIHEPTTATSLTHSNGTLSMARSEVGSATSEFFICIGEQRIFDAGQKGTPDNAGFAAFGKVIEGMNVVRKIQAAKNDGDRITEKITIKNITRL